MRKYQRKLSDSFRAKRNIFLRDFLLRNGRRVLDVGGTPRYWQQVGTDFLSRNGFDITIVNLREEDFETTAGSGPWKCIVGDATSLDMPDNSFDVVHSNSLIEHVGTDEQMKAVAGEVRRLAPAYYLQTPNWWFPIDPHFWRMPGFHWLPRTVRRELLYHFPIATSGKLRPRSTADQAIDHTRLLTGRKLRGLFPDGELHREKLMGLSKSLIVTRDS